LPPLGQFPSAYRVLESANLYKGKKSGLSGGTGIALPRAMRSWIVLHLPSRSLVRVIARSLERVLAVCRKRGWSAGDLMIRIK